MKKRMLALLLLGAMLFTVSGCKKPNPEDEYSFITSEILVDDDASNSASGNKSDKSQSANQQSGSSNASSSGTGVNGETIDVSKIAVIQPVNIKKGSKTVDDGVNFGGKTFTMAITQEAQFHNDAFKRKIAAFEKKFNCKIKTVQLTFGTYNKDIQAALSAGTSYDICFQHGSQYPVGIKDKLFKSFSNVVTTADLQNQSNPTAGGIDLTASSYFAYKGEMYGLSHYYSAYPLVMYYNKKMCSAAGIDPQQLYKAGKWNWNYILQNGRKLTDKTKDVYFLDDVFGVYRSFGTGLITMKDGKPVVNLTSTPIINAFNLSTQMYNSSNGIAKMGDDAGATSNDRFVAGKSYIKVQESSKWSELAKAAKTSVAFGKSVDNLGIVPLPMNTTDKDAYTFDWLRCVAAGVKTKDVRVAACYAKFEATYVDPVKDNISNITGANKEIVDKLMATKNKIVNHGRYYTSSKNTLDITTDMEIAIYKGGDIAQLTKQAQQECENAIKNTWK